MPLSLVLFIIFAWAMNGDVFRDFFLVPVLTFPPPVEKGVAPFEARLWIFISLILLLFLSITLSLARAFTPPKEGWDDETSRRWRGAVKDGDDWEREYGVTVGRLARRRMALAVMSSVRPRWGPHSGQRRRLSAGNGDSETGQQGEVEGGVVRWNSVSTERIEVVVPLNILCLPLDLALAICRLAGPFSANATASKLRMVLLEARGWVSVLAMGPLCYILACIGRLHK